MDKTNDERVVVISPCRNEESTLPITIECMRNQTRPPDVWIIVDDGSTDETPEILRKSAEELPWLKVVRRENRGHRKVGGGVVDAFYDGLAHAEGTIDFVAKMDVDLEFSPSYIEKLLGWFRANPSLAAASGKVFRRENGRFIEEYIIDEMVAGQFKFYRKQAFDQIGGFVREVMWDGIDFHRARMANYVTASLRNSELRLIHLRQMGSSEGNVYRGRLRWGRGQWFMGTAFPYLLASGVFRMRETPYFVGGLLIILGYLLAALRRVPRYPDEGFRRELRRWQYRRLKLLLQLRSPEPHLDLIDPAAVKQ